MPVRRLPYHIGLGMGAPVIGQRLVCHELGDAVQKHGCLYTENDRVLFENGDP